MECRYRVVWRVGQAVDDVFDLKKRARPPMDEQKRNGILSWGFMVDEVQRDWPLVVRTCRFDGGCILCQSIWTMLVAFGLNTVL